MTDDDLDALRLYQRAAARRWPERHAGGVDRARELKPEIPSAGLDGTRSAAS